MQIVTFEDLAKYTPLAKDNHTNQKPLSTDEIVRLAPEDLKHAAPAPGALNDNKEFYEYTVTLSDGKPVVFMLRGTDLEIGVNSFGKTERPEFKLNLASNGVGQHALFVLAEYIRCFVKETYGQDIAVKSPMYKLIASLPWVHSYGKNGDIEVKTRHSVFSCNLQVNAEALKRIMVSNAGGEFELRVVLKAWMLREKLTGVIKAGYKLHVQQVVAL